MTESRPSTTSKPAVVTNTATTRPTTTTTTAMGATGGRAEQPHSAVAERRDRITGRATAARGPDTAPQMHGVDDRSSGVVNFRRGDELRQLVDTIADIDRDVRAMAAALQSSTGAAAPRGTGAAADRPWSSNVPAAESGQRNAVARPATSSVGGGGGGGGRGTAVAILLPSTELCVTPNSDNTAQTTHVKSLF